MLKFYKKEEKPKEPTLKEPLFTIDNNRFVVVDTEGNRVAILFIVRSGHKCVEALGRLQEAGYRTDWAEWGGQGSFLSFKEEFE